MLAAAGFRARTAWEFGLYRGTVLLAARRAAEAVAGIRDPGVVRGLQRDMGAKAAGVHDWLAAEHAVGHCVVGDGAYLTAA